MCIVYDKSHLTPIGMVKICCCDEGVHTIKIYNRDSEETTKMIDKSNTSDENQTPMLKKSLCWLKSYFNSLNKTSENLLPPVCPLVLLSKGQFTRSVWTTLLANVPPGNTISYGALAELSGNAGASRAVGTAMKNNPIPLLIPCHRVVKSDGSVGHYSGGEGVKEWLLQHENVAVEYN